MSEKDDGGRSKGNEGLADELSRLWHYLRGDQVEAEGLDRGEPAEEIPWLEDSADEHRAEYALQASIRSAQFAAEAASSVQQRAAQLLPVILTLATIAIAATGFALSRKPWWVAGLPFVLTDLALLMAAVGAFLCTGMISAVGLNTARLAKNEEGPSLARLRVDEARTWHASFWTATQVASFKAKELFRVRRRIIYALVFAAVGTVALVFTSSHQATSPRIVPSRSPAVRVSNGTTIAPTEQGRRTPPSGSP